MYSAKFDFSDSSKIKSSSLEDCIKKATKVISNYYIITGKQGIAYIYQNNVCIKSFQL